MEKYCFAEEKRKMLEELPLALAVYQFVNNRLATLVLSDGFCSLFGFESRADACRAMDHDMYRLCHPEDVARVADAGLRFATRGGAYDVVYRTRYREGSDYRVIHANGENVAAEDGTRLAYVWYVDEGPYTKEPGKREEIFRQSVFNALHDRDNLPAQMQHDYLTGLPGKGFFFRGAQEEVTRLRQEGSQAAFLFFDLNGMKFYNTQFGFAGGDRLLRSFGKLIGKTFGNENCCHLGGDHFAAHTRADGIEDVLRNMFRECAQLNEGNSLPVHVGICVSRMDETPVTVACDRAKFACDELRNVFESSFSYYNETLNDDLSHRRYILSHFEQAMEEEWIEVYYQPIVRSVSAEISDEEALARWNDPEEGVLSPAMFIPILEEARVIYKLDLYMLDQILKKLKIQEEVGLFLVPQSLNLSRSDFDSCDMVEEIRKRVDGAGISRDMITIEITETTIGKNYDFMKKQVERFQALGFPVWMDDFGSGYSSLDILQSIQFDLIKFDMSFMRRLDEGVNGRIILTELMKMATALGVDTVCEGVETKEQKQFLQEIGCSKLQGYYFSKPNPLRRILEMKADGVKIRYENPKEADYYETISRVNLYDLDVIAHDQEKFFRNYFNTLPMAILEMNKEEAQFIRSNPSYRFFAKRFFGFDLSDEASFYSVRPVTTGREFMDLVRQSNLIDGNAFVNEKMPDGSVVHSFIRKIGENPVTGKIAVAIAVLSLEDSDVENTYINIAREFAPNNFYTCYVNLDTDEYIEFSSAPGNEKMKMEIRGRDFFEAGKQAASNRLIKEDRERFLHDITREKVLKQMEETGGYEISYRLDIDGAAVPVKMQVMRIHPKEHHLIISVNRLEG